MQSYTSLCKGSNTNTLTVLKTSCNVILMSWLASLAAYVRLEVDSLIRYKCIYFLYIYYTINTYLVTDLLLCHSLKKTHTHLTKGPGGLSPIRRGFALGFVNYKKGCTRLAAASDKVNQLLAQWSLVLSGYFQNENWSPWYSWNIAESGVKHQQSINQSSCVVQNK